MYWLRREDSQRRKSNCRPLEPDSKPFLKDTCLLLRIMARSFMRAAAMMRAEHLNWRALTSRTVQHYVRSSRPMKWHGERTKHKPHAKFLWMQENSGEERQPSGCLHCQPGSTVQTWSQGGQPDDNAA